MHQPIQRHRLGGPRAQPSDRGWRANPGVRRAAAMTGGYPVLQQFPADVPAARRRAQVAREVRLLVRPSIAALDVNLSMLSLSQYRLAFPLKILSPKCPPLSQLSPFVKSPLGCASMRKYDC